MRSLRFQNLCGLVINLATARTAALRTPALWVATQRAADPGSASRCRKSS